MIDNNVLDFLVESCKDICSCHSNYSRSLKYIKAFVSSDVSFMFDDSLPAPAAINMSRKIVYVNKKSVCNMLIDCIFKLVELPLDKQKLFFPKFSSGHSYFHADYYEDIENVFYKLSDYLFLHESWHYRFSPSTNMEIEAIKQYCPNIPSSLSSACSNFVEDGRIEYDGFMEFSNEDIKSAVLFGTYFTNTLQKDNYIDICNSNGWRIKDKLYYFIIRAYAVNDSLVQSMYNNCTDIGWSQETLAAFDKCIKTSDKLLRCRRTFENFVPSVYKDLLIYLDNSSNDSSDSTGDLLDATSIVDSSSSSSSSSNSSSNPDSDVEHDEDYERSWGPSDSDDSEEDCSDCSDFASENTSEDNSSGNSEEPKETNESTSDGANPSEEDSSDSSSSCSSQDSSEDSSCDDSVANDSDSETNSGDNQNLDTSNTADDTTSSSDGLSNSKPLSNDDIIDTACIDLLNELRENVSRDIPDSLPSTDPEQTRILLNNVKYIDNNALSLLCNSYNYTGIQEPFHYQTELNDSGKNLLSSFTSYLRRLRIVSSGVRTNLSEGDDVDENLIPSYYFEKNTNIFMRRDRYVGKKDVQVVLVIDTSSSVKPLAVSFVNIIASLVQSFENCNISTCIYTFSSKSYLLKDFKNRFALDSSFSCRYLTALFSLFANGGCTNPSNAAADLVSRNDIVSNNRLETLVFYFTDGSMDDYSVEDSVKQSCIALTNKGVRLFGITLDLSDCLFDRLKDILGDSAVVRNYSSNDLTSLAEDVYRSVVSNTNL